MMEIDIFLQSPLRCSILCIISFSLFLMNTKNIHDAQERNHTKVKEHVCVREVQIVCM